MNRFQWHFLGFTITSFCVMTLLISVGIVRSLLFPEYKCPPPEKGVAAELAL